MFPQISIIGVGLIGGSLGLEIRRKKLAKKVVGCGRSAANLKIAGKRKLVDETTTDLFSAVKDADLIILASPVGTIRSQLKVIARCAKKGALVIDVGSTKEGIVKEAGRVLPKTIYFVGTHPMAGTEQSGAVSAMPDLFKGKKCILTPGKATSLPALRKAQAFWKKIGSEVVIMRPENHDRVVGAISHLPQIVSSALIRAIAEKYDPKIVAQIAGKGFRDTTRIAASNAGMWRDIMLANSKNIRPLLRKCIHELEKVDELIGRKQEQALTAYLNRASLFRKKIQ